MSTITTLQLFNGLKQEVWRQYIDLQHQHLGKDVYDEAKHKGVKEPGYLNSMLEAHEKALTYLGKKITSEEYAEIHQKAMQHDKRYQEEHLFRVDATYCPFMRVLFEDGFVQGIDKEIVPKLLPFEEEYDKKRLAKYSKNANKTITADMLNALYFRYSFSFGRGDREKTKNKLDEILSLIYSDLDNIEASTQTEDDKRKNKIKRLTRFYKEIEFLHPYTDGNTRTNLVVLNKILCEYNLNPVILSDINFPFTKKLETMEVWLEQGISRWRAAAKAIEKGKDIEEALKIFDTEHENVLLHDKEHLYEPK